MKSRGPEDSKNVKTSQAYFFEGFISFFEDFSLTTMAYHRMGPILTLTMSIYRCSEPGGHPRAGRLNWSNGPM